MKMKLSEEFTHKLTEAQKEIIEQVTNNLQGEWRKRVLEEETDEEPGALALALAGKYKESRNRNIECILARLREKDRKKKTSPRLVRRAERKLTDVNALEEPDEEPGALALALAGKVKENDNIESVNVPDPVQEEQTEEENSESDESDIEISNIRYAVSSESEEE